MILTQIALNTLPEAVLVAKLAALLRERCGPQYGKKDAKDVVREFVGRHIGRLGEAVYDEATRQNRIAYQRRQERSRDLDQRWGTEHMRRRKRDRVVRHINLVWERCGFRSAKGGATIEVGFCSVNFYPNVELSRGLRFSNVVQERVKTDYHMVYVREDWFKKVYLSYGGAIDGRLILDVLDHFADSPVVIYAQQDGVTITTRVGRIEFAGSLKPHLKLDYAG